MCKMKKEKNSNLRRYYAMVEVNKNIAAQSLKWLEVLLDENDALSNEEKGQIQTLINFWRMYCSFTSE